MEILKRIKIVELQIGVYCSDHIHKDWIFEDKSQSRKYIVTFPVGDYWENFDE